MQRIHRLVAPLALATALTLGACSGEADVDVHGDSTDVNGSIVGDGDSAAISNPATDGDTAVSVNGDSVGAAVDSAANGAANEGIEKLVETHLALTEGFSGVDVESEGDGVIVLTGTVASDAEKTAAETETKTVAGVKSVRNELTVKK